MYKGAEDIDHGLSYLLHTRHIVVVGVHTKSDGDLSLLPIDTAAEGGVPRVRGGVFFRGIL